VVEHLTSKHETLSSKRKKERRKKGKREREKERERERERERDWVIYKQCKYTAHSSRG
jgi:hypothetical protein